MITFGGFILLLTALYGSIRLIFFYMESKSIYYLSMAVAALSLAVGVGGSELEGYLPFINSSLVADWSRVITASFVLSGVAMLLWMSKPSFARFPVIFCSSPLLLILAFPFIIKSSALKEMILAMFQGGAITIGILLYTLKGIQDPDNYYVVGGISLVLIAILLYWISIDITPIPIWIAKLVLVVSILLITYGFGKLVEKENMELEEIV
ncbi:MAG: hypothetical protein WEB89_05755 [Balneolales bacterium]